MKTKHVEMMRELRLWGKFGLDVLNTLNQIRLVNGVFGVTNVMVKKKTDELNGIKEKVYDRSRINKINSIFENPKEKVPTPEERAAMMTEEEKARFHQECAEALNRITDMENEVKKLL